jgi:hypothetical protein
MSIIIRGNIIERRRMTPLEARPSRGLLVEIVLISHWDGTVEKGRVRLLPNRYTFDIPDFKRFGRSLTLPFSHYIDFFNSPGMTALPEQSRRDDSAPRTKPSG